VEKSGGGGAGGLGGAGGGGGGGRGGKALSVKRVFIISAVFSETFLISRRTEGDMSKCVYWSSCKEPVILVQF